jgi:hypothetical protein
MNDDIYPHERTLRRLLKRIETELEDDSEHILKWYLYIKTDKKESLVLKRLLCL